MHVLAINGSPRNEQSCTYQMLAPLLEGMRSAGATTEVVHLGKLEIKHCLGCFLCWVRTPGKCAQKDDMDELLEKYVQADMLIFGTPLYHYTMSGLMKNFIDRTLPVHEPWLVEDPEHQGWSRHPNRFDKKHSMLLVSPCGFPEFDYFEPLLHYFHFLAEKMKFNYLGEILRPGGEILRDEQQRKMISWYFDLLVQAGEQLVHRQEIAPEVQSGLRRNLFPGGAESFRKAANEHWQESMRRFGVDDKPPLKCK